MLNKLRNTFIFRYDISCFFSLTAVGVVAVSSLETTDLVVEGIAWPRKENTKGLD